MIKNKIEMISKSELTGRWYLEKRYLGGYNVLVEEVTEHWSDPSFGNGGASYDPPIRSYRIATDLDILYLDIKQLKQ